MTIFLAGHETTATGLAWAAWALAAHPEVQARAAREVDEVLGRRAPEFADVAQLTYLGQVVKETLRLYSPAPGVFMRQATEEVRIGDWRLPRSALVSILSVVTHRDERWFDDPLRFDPERFDPQTAKRIPRGAYFPFGTGPRVCIGNSVATMEMTLALTMLLQRYTLRPAPGQQEPGLSMQVTVRPAGGLRLVLGHRAGRLEAGAAGAGGSKVPVSASGCPFHALGGST